jgi:hypothetical protein
MSGLACELTHFGRFGSWSDRRAARAFHYGWLSLWKIYPGNGRDPSAPPPARSGPRFLPRSRRGRRVRVSRLPGVADGPWHCEPTVFAGPDGGAVVIVFSSLQLGPPASGVPSGFHHCGCPRLSIITGQAFPACFWPCRLPGQWAG